MRVSRRSLLSTAAAGGAAVVLGGCAPDMRPGRGATPPAADRLVLLGTRGGPNWSLGRLGIGSALVLGDAVYVIDTGDGTARQLALALDPELGRGQTFTGIRGIFLTHLHSDHVMDYYTLLAYGVARGLGAAKPVPVLGPGRRGAVQPATAQRLAAEPEAPLINPTNPAPGTVDMTRSLMAAFALDLNDRVRDLGQSPLETLVAPQDIALPTALRYDPNTPQPPSMEPFEVYRDELVRVTATLVSHFPVSPSFGFRFDTPAASVVFSGDTGPSENLIRLAAGADVLVHEVIDPDWIARRPLAEQQHHRIAHTPADQVAGIATRAGAKALVLTHIVPGETPDEKLRSAGAGFPGDFLVGSDGLQIPL